jgi:hypothetical protein
MSSPMTIVSAESIVTETSVCLKSHETRGRSVIASTPFCAPTEALRKASLTWWVEGGGGG